MAERPRHGMMGANKESLALYVLFFSPWKGHCRLFSYILCICFRPQQRWAVEYSIGVHIELEKTTFSKGNNDAVLAPLLLFFSVPTLPLT